MAALAGLWAVFTVLPAVGQARCVGITKAVKLVTLGRVGPALDSEVRGRLGLEEPLNAEQWVAALKRVAANIATFEGLPAPSALDPEPFTLGRTSPGAARG